MKINVNDRVSVRLTKDGDKTHRQYKKRHGSKSYSFEKDRQGRIEFQLWELVHIFGHTIGLCKPTPFVDSTIEFPSQKT